MKKRLKILSFKAVGTVIPHTLEDVQTSLSEMGHRVFVVDLPEIHENHMKEIAIMDALVDINPDLVFTIDSVGLLPSQYLTMRPEMKVISWFFDDPAAFLREMDVSLFNSRYHLFCWDRAYEDVVKSLGVSRFSYMPFASNPKIYKPSEKEKIYDVSFVGTWSEKRQRILTGLAERNIKIDLFGNERWSKLKHRNICFHGFADNRTECPEIYSRSKINLNITNEQLLTSLPLRIFDVGACKAFLLTDEQEDARKIFSEEELPVYRNPDELAVKLKYYLENERERENTAQKLYERISTDFTYARQLEKILQEVSLDTQSPLDRKPEGEELMTILWKTSLSLMHFKKYNDAIALLYIAAKVQTQVSQKKIVNALTLALCLKLAGRESESEAIISNNDILKLPFQRLTKMADYGELRTALYYLKETSFNSEGEIPSGSARRVSCSS